MRIEHASPELLRQHAAAKAASARIAMAAVRKPVLALPGLEEDELPIELPEPVNGEVLPIDALVSMPRERPFPNAVAAVMHVVAEFYGIEHADILGISRLPRFIMPRQVAMFLSKEITGSSYPNIGQRFGGRDHTTIMHAVRKISALLATDAGLATDISVLRMIMTEYRADRWRRVDRGDMPGGGTVHLAYIRNHLVPEAVAMGWLPRGPASAHSVACEWRCCCGREPPRVGDGE